MDRFDHDVVYQTAEAIMSTNLADPRCVRTRRAVQHAFMDLVGEADVDTVSVQQVCRKAGVSRSTFYLHYQDKYALLAKCMLDLLDVSAEETERAEVGGRLPELIRLVAARCVSRRRFLLRVLEDGKFPAFHNLFTRHMEQEVGRLIEQLMKEGSASRSAGSPHRLTFLSSAYFGSLLHWVKYGEQDELDEFCASIASFTMAVLNGAP
jgi:AcrR family transcriptional regulator